LRFGAQAVGITVLSLALAAPLAHAQRRGRARASEVEAQLAGADRDAVRVAMENVGISGDARLIPPLAERIRRGLPPDLLDVAVDTLTVLARPEAGPVLFELATHRRGEVRLKAIEAIVACRPRGAPDALVAALSDPDPRVRAAAAVGLGQLAARESIDSLFHALDRGILEASTSIGQLARPEHVTRLVGYLGQLPFDVVTPGLNEALARDDIPERTKLDVVARIAELATPEARTFLEELAASLPEERRNQAVRQAALEAAERIVR
jgi:HEAT repeat protein